MRAMFLTKFGQPVEPATVPDPSPGSGEVLVRVRVCVTGLTVAHFRRGRTGGDLPRIPGHEVAGTVEAVGPGVAGVSPGDRVAAYYYLICGHCVNCQAGRENLCLNQRGTVGKAIEGGYADFIILPSRNLIPIPPEVSFEAAATCCDAIGTPVHIARQRARISPLQNVLVVGAGGGVGIHMAQVARAFGARVIVADITAEKLQALRELGFEDQVNPLARAMAVQVQELTQGRGVDSAIDFAVTPESMASCLDSLAMGGTLVTVGYQHGNAVPVEARRLISGEITITGSRYCNRRELAQAMQLVAAASVKPMVTRSFPLDQAEEAHRLIDNNLLIGRAALYPEGP